MKLTLSNWLALVFLLALIFIVTGTHAQCPNTGDTKNAIHQHSDALKNRLAGLNRPAIAVDLNTLFSGKNDTALYASNARLNVTGYIVLVKTGGPETCNCHSRDKNNWDWHIEISATPRLNKKAVMICEVTQYTKDNVGVTWEELLKLKGKKVTITGWAFHDSEHWQNSYNTNPGGTDLWRGTDIEIHPVTSIKTVGE